MLKLIIEDDEGRKTVVPFVREEITIGRQEGNTIRLTERNVSRRHARLLRQNGHVVVEDLGSSNGTRINGERISGQSAIKDGDLIQIGDYDLALQSEAAAAAAAKAAKAAPAPAADEDDEPSDPDASGSEPETELETPVAEDSANGGSADARRHSTAIISLDKVEANRSRKVKELEAEVAPRLVVVSAELKGQEFACIRTEMRIGRTDDNDIVIDHRSLSRTHAKIVREDNGEWRIMDMQSANGLTVNGESYAQASLSPGDVIELGHVKLRFVAAGDAAGAGASGGRSKLPLVAAFVLLAGGGAAAFFLLKGPTDAPKPPEITTNDPPKPPEQPQQVDPPEAKQPTPTPPPPDQPPVEPGAQAAKDMQARLESAKQALAQGKLDKAEDDLSPLKKADGTWPDEVKLLVSELEAEKQAMQALTDAQKALDAKQLDEAEQLLSKAEITSAFAAKREELAAALAEARKAAIKVEPPKPPQTTPPKPPPPLGPSPQEQAKTAYEDARRLLKAQQYGDALFMGNKCLELDPKNSECHMVLGATYASMENKMEQAAFHYREFLKLAPDHKLAPRIKQNLDEYEKRNPKKP